MTSEALAAERARFWRSAWRYYHYINRASGSPNCYDELAWEHAKERLLAVAEREKWGPAPIELPPAPHYRHRCPACGEKQAGREVCAECVALWGSAEAAMRARQATRPGKRPGPRPSKPPHKPQHTQGELRAMRTRRRAEIAAKLREHLAKYGEVHVPTIKIVLGVSHTTVQEELHKIMTGADGQPPVELKKPDSYDRYWRVTDVHS